MRILISLFALFCVLIVAISADDIADFAADNCAGGLVAECCGARYRCAGRLRLCR